MARRAKGVYNASPSCEGRESRSRCITAHACYRAQGVPGAQGPVALTGANIAPTNKTCTCFHTGLEKSGANSLSRDNNAAGNVSIERPLVEKVVFSLRCLPLRFQRAKMAKVELRPASPKARKSPEVMAGFGLCASSSPP